VLVVGATALKQVSREEIIASMRDGSVVVNVDHRHRPGRGIETARPIPRSDPTYVDEVAIHYCVANILAEVASTSIVVLSGGLLPYLVKISDEGAGGVATADSNLAKGISTLGDNLVSNWSPRPTDFSHREFLAV
jgi:alanine dehydrogenase